MRLASFCFAVVMASAGVAFAQTGQLRFKALTPVVNIGVPVTIPIFVDGGTPPYIVSLANAEAMPPGLMYNLQDQELSGTPTKLGDYQVTFLASDAAGASIGNTYTISVVPKIAITGQTTLPAATVGQSYAQQLTATNGAPPYTWSLTGGALPPGFRFDDQRGIIGGVASGTGGTYTFTMTATDAQGVSANQTYTIQVNPATPLPTVTSVVNAASFQAGLAPGTYATVFGSSLAASTASATGFPLPDTLGNVSVTVNGVRAPLLSVSPTQINFQVPFATAVGKASVVVTTGGVATPLKEVDVLAAAPGIFQSAPNRAAVINQDGTINSASRPATAGTVVSLYTTGAGAFSTLLTTGGTAPSTPIGRGGDFAGPVSVTIGGSPAEILYAGTAPGQASGLFQINVRVPTARNSPVADLEVQVTINGQKSNTPLMTVITPI